MKGDAFLFQCGQFCIYGGGIEGEVEGSIDEGGLEGGVEEEEDEIGVEASGFVFGGGVGGSKMIRMVVD